MAREILYSIESYQTTKALAEHQPKHDLESLIYVLGYSIMRHVLTAAHHAPALCAQYEEIFGCMTPSEIGLRRCDQEPLSWLYVARMKVIPEIKGHISRQIFDLFCTLGLRLMASRKKLMYQFINEAMKETYGESIVSECQVQFLQSLTRAPHTGAKP